MSAVLEQPVSIGVPGSGGQTPHLQQIVSDSATRWVWFPFVEDISFMGPNGREIKNSIEPELEDDGGLIFCGMRRCTPYPLVNYEYNVVRHEQVGFDPPPSYGNFGMNDELGTEPIATPKYARVAAEELMGKYAIDYGMITLAPLNGADSDVVRKVFAILQPFYYKLHELDDQLTVGAATRAAEMSDETVVINGQTKQLSDVAEACRRLMRVGVGRANQTALEQYGEFDRDARAYIGSKKGRHTATEHDKRVAEQLGLVVPTSVQPVPAQGESPQLNALLEKLTENATNKSADAEQMAAQFAEMRAEREAEKVANARLTAQVQELIEAKKIPEVPEEKEKKK